MSFGGYVVKGNLSKMSFIGGGTEKMDEELLAGTAL